jgi:SAM-dependent methyltransferase
MSRWPKQIPELTSEQQAIADDFVHYWHEVLPKRFSVADRFGHQYVARTAPAEFTRTLEIGAGLGEHLAYETLSRAQLQNYYTIDIRENMAEGLRKAWPGVNATVGDCQKRQPFPDGFFDRIIAIHVLEHLPNLPAAIREVHRLCSPSRGLLQVVIPCEGGMAYSLARKMSAQRIFEQRYRQPYNWFIEREHINLPSEIMQELTPFFTLSRRTYFPLVIPIETVNLFIAFTMYPKQL